MKRFFLWLAVAAFANAGNLRQAPLAPVALLTDYQEEPDVAVRAAMQSELAAIMEPIGLHFEWKQLHGAENAPAVELVVVTFRGRCDADFGQSSNATPAALGWTHVSNGTVLPFSDVDCGALTNFLHDDLMRRHPVERAAIFGRAMARVLAHELYHVLAGTEEHGDCGVAKSGFTVADLMSRVFTFQRTELYRLVTSRSYKVLAKAAALAATF